jgi:hypothetical protein
MGSMRKMSMDAKSRRRPVWKKKVVELDQAETMENLGRGLSSSWTRMAKINPDTSVN